MLAVLRQEKDSIAILQSALRTKKPAIHEQSGLAVAVQGVMAMAVRGVKTLLESFSLGQVPIGPIIGRGLLLAADVWKNHGGFAWPDGIFHGIVGIALSAIGKLLDQPSLPHAEAPTPQHPDAQAPAPQPRVQAGPWVQHHEPALVDPWVQHPERAQVAENVTHVSAASGELFAPGADGEDPWNPWRGLQSGAFPMPQPNAPAPTTPSATSVREEPRDEPPKRPNPYPWLRITDYYSENWRLIQGVFPTCLRARNTLTCYVGVHVTRCHSHNDVARSTLT